MPMTTSFIKFVEGVIIFHDYIHKMLREKLKTMKFGHYFRF